MHHAAAKLKKLLARVAVAAVLLHRVLDGLLGEAVFQLEGGDRQAVDKQAQIERAACFVVTVGELARDRKTILGVQRLCLGVALGGCAVEQIEMPGRMMLNALAQYVDDAALADLGRDATEKFEAVDVLGVIGIGHCQLLEGLGLGDAQESEELRHVKRVGAVVILCAACEVASAAVGRGRFGDPVRHDGKAIHAGHVAHDERFESLFAGVRGHLLHPHQLPIN